MPRTTHLSDAQLHSIMLIERVNSGLSIAGCLFIAFTFIYSKAFHKPINRLVFYASVGNIMTNIATLISRDAILNVDGALCQIQGFLIQMFMCADACWTLAMACNVYLTFFWKFDADRLRTIEKWYFLICYGIPAIPAFIYIFITKRGVHVYGNATLWCWVDKEWDIMRIVTFYAPIWVVIFLTFAIYIRTGKEIFSYRRQLRFFQNQLNPANDFVAHYSREKVKNPFAPTKTTEISVTSESAIESEQPIDPSCLGRRATIYDKPLYTVTVSSNASGRVSSLSVGALPLPSTPPPPSSSSSKAYRTMGITPTQYRTTSLPPLPPSERPQLRPRTAFTEANSAAWGYTKVAVLFFTAMLVTWIPSSANRVYSFVHPGYISPPLQFASAFVLPLQGFWNAVIYTMTSWAACKHLFGWMLWRIRRAGVSRVGEMSSSCGFPIRSQRGGNVKETESETASTAELASRPASRMEVPLEEQREEQFEEQSERQSEKHSEEQCR